VIDTSALVAALVADHEFHGRVRPRLTSSTAIPAIVLAETYAQLRRTFRQSANAAAALLAPWSSRTDLILGAESAVVRTVFARAAELDLGGNIHDALVAAVCATNDVVLVTLDRRQHAVALAFGVDSTLLLPTG